VGKNKINLKTMEYKEKLVDLMKKCLNDEKLYERTIDQVDARRSTSTQSFYNKVSAIYCGYFDKFIGSRVEYYYNNVKCKSVSKMKEKHKLIDSSEYLKDKFLSELYINFEEHPPLRLNYSSVEKREETNIEIPNKRFLIFDGPKQYVIKTTYTYTPLYIIQQGSLKAELTIEEANELIELYKSNNKKFEEKRDLEKLEGRLKKYNS